MSLSSRSLVLAATLLAAGGYWLWAAEPGWLGAAVPYLPFLVILLCPLMHLLMHRNHGASRSDVPQVGKRPLRRHGSDTS